MMQTEIQFTLYSTKNTFISLWLLYTLGITKIVLKTQNITQLQYLWAVICGRHFNTKKQTRTLIRLLKAFRYVLSCRVKSHCCSVVAALHPAEFMSSMLLLQLRSPGKKKWRDRDLTSYFIKMCTRSRYEMSHLKTFVLKSVWIVFWKRNQFRWTTFTPLFLLLAAPHSCFWVQWGERLWSNSSAAGSAALGKNQGE